MGDAQIIRSEGLELAGYLARPTTTSGTGTARMGLVICHGFPVDAARAANAPGQSYPQLADRLAADAGWIVLTFNFRGCGESQGDFSLGGWLADLQAATEHLLSATGVEGVWLCGFSAGGSLALCAAGEDDRVRGVAALSAPADFSDWAADPRRFVQQARTVGVIHRSDFPEDLDAWGRQLREIRPLALIAKVPPRPVLLVHGSNDEVVPVVDARALSDAADNQVEMRILAGAGHRLRHDPRAVAVLLGWLDRQFL